MAFKEVTSLEAEVTISLGGANRKTGKKNPSSVEGYYLGKREVDDVKKKSGKSYIYYFQTKTGNLGVWGKTDLDRKMTSATLGSMTRVSHSGMRATPNGEMYVYKVEIDSDNTIEVSGPTEAVEASGYNDGTDEQVEESEEEAAYTEEDDAEQEAALQAAVKTAAERKAKVQAILAKGKKA